MVSKFEELMKRYGKVKQFPTDAPLMPLSKEQSKQSTGLSLDDPTVVVDDPVPMQDLPDPQFKPMDQVSYQEVARVDPPDGLLPQVPPRVDPDPMAGMPSPLRSPEETKGKKPK